MGDMGNSAACSASEADFFNDDGSAMTASRRCVDKGRISGLGGACSVAGDKCCAECTRGRISAAAVSSTSPPAKRGLSDDRAARGDGGAAGNSACLPDRARDAGGSSPNSDSGAGEALVRADPMRRMATCDRARLIELD